MLSADELTAERRMIEASQTTPRQFARLYERYFERIYAFAMAKTRDRAAAEDVTAETFRRAFQNISRFEWRGVPFSAWLFRIAANVAIDHQKAAGRPLPEDALPQEWEAVFVEIEERVRLSELVHRLPRDQGCVIVLRFIQGKTIKDIAIATGRSEGAIKSLQSRALHHLRDWLRDDDE